MKKDDLIQESDKTVFVFSVRCRRHSVFYSQPLYVFITIDFCFLSRHSITSIAPFCQQGMLGVYAFIISEFFCNRDFFHS